jgi:endonuclease YncB( thermonuclease family)
LNIVFNVVSFFRKLMHEFHAKGFAEIYRGKGAQYCGMKDIFEDRQTRAQVEKRGIWSLGRAWVSAAEEKKRRKKQAAEL